MKSKPMPATFECSPSRLACPVDSFDNPLNPRPNTDQLPSIADQGTQPSMPTGVLWASNPTWHPGHLSPHPCFGVALHANGYPVIHPAMIDQNPTLVSIETPTLFPI